ncbi:MAG: ParB/RepB/Spo0J family partition protein [Deltaproteobacteria bacterium]|nr:ParB/RepB/Spo0J family partition protein [Deltaproteobacteria bacterium]
MVQRKVLGRGIGALLPTDEEDKKLITCGIEEIVPNRYQPRKVFDSEKLKELAASIKGNGVIQPLLARRTDSGYELIAGERRWRAAQMAGLRDVPVIIREVRDTEMLELALIENIQRAELNPIEEAEGYQKLVSEFDYTQEELSIRVGKERSTIANYLRLLRLPEQIKEDISKGVVSTGHAKAILGLETPQRQIEAHAVVVKKGLSVRETESLVKRIAKGQPVKKVQKASADIDRLQEGLMRSLCTKVRIAGSGRKGKIVIEYYSSDELDRLVSILRGG